MKAPKRFNNVDDDGFLKKHLGNSVGDPMLIHREYYNPNKCELIFERRKELNVLRHIWNSGINVGPERTILKPDEFLYLPHGYYVITTSDGRPYFDMVANYGELIGTGNKKASHNIQV